MTFDLEHGAQASNIFWVVQDAATISPSVPITFDGDILAGTSFTMSAASSGAFSGTINGCVFSRTANTLAAATDVNGCSASSVPEPGSAGLVLSLGGLLGILAWTRKRAQLKDRL
jgi:MYXO-CTERM domain-containing protein